MGTRGPIFSSWPGSEAGPGRLEEGNGPSGHPEAGVGNTREPGQKPQPPPTPAPGRSVRRPCGRISARGSGAYAIGRWGSCWPGSAGCRHTCYTGRGGDRAESGCPGHLRDTPHTQHCYRLLRPQPPVPGDRDLASDTNTFMSHIFFTSALPEELRQVVRTKPYIYFELPKKKNVYF